jgi:hypothetical protein
VTRSLALVLLAGALLAPGLLLGPALDAAVFSHVAGRLLDGAAPYVGSWDHKPPGIYLADAGAQALLGWLGQWTADWLVTLAATVGIGLGVAAALGRLGVDGWPRRLAAAGAVAFGAEYLLALGGGLTEAPAAALTGAAIALALSPTRRAQLLAVGALLGLAVTFSVQTIPGVVAVLLLMRGNPKGLAITAVGFVVPVTLVVGWLALAGALPAAVDAIVGYTAAYRASSAAYGGALSGPVISWTLLASLALIAPAIIGAAHALEASGPQRNVAAAAIAWIALAVILFVVQGRFLAHYVIPLGVPLGILSGLGLEPTWRSLGAAKKPVERAFIVLPLVITLVISIAAGTIGGSMEAAAVAGNAQRLQKVASYIRDTQGGAGTMLVWGNQPRLYDLAGRSPATRFSYFYPLTTPGFTTEAMIDEVTRQLADRPPVFVVDAGSSSPGAPGFLPLLLPRPIATDGRDLDLLDPLRGFVAARYQLKAVVDGWPVYVLRGAAAS